MAIKKVNELHILNSKLSELSDEIDVIKLKSIETTNWTSTLFMSAP